MAWKGDPLERLKLWGILHFADESGGGGGGDDDGDDGDNADTGDDPGEDTGPDTEDDVSVDDFDFSVDEDGLFGPDPSEERDSLGDAFGGLDDAMSPGSVTGDDPVSGDFGDFGGLDFGEDEAAAAREAIAGIDFMDMAAEFAIDAVQAVVSIANPALGVAIGIAREVAKAPAEKQARAAVEALTTRALTGALTNAVAPGLKSLTSATAELGFSVAGKVGAVAAAGATRSLAKEGISSVAEFGARSLGEALGSPTGPAREAPESVGGKSLLSASFESTTPKGLSFTESPSLSQDLFSTAGSSILSAPVRTQPPRALNEFVGADLISKYSNIYLKEVT